MNNLSARAVEQCDTAGRVTTEELPSQQMFKIQDTLIMFAALISFLFSVTLWFSGERDTGVFVGIWVPSILAFGAYLKALTRSE